jgi:FKBP-type peptidyl-prolyl cis-trans isomerase SlyD
MIRSGSRVSIHYTLTVDGEIVESTSDKAPLTFVHGAGEIFSGLEEQLLGHGPGDRASFELQPDKGFGHPDPEAVQTIPRSVLDLPDSLAPGQTVSGCIAGDAFRGRIVAIGENEITLDLNHPLAGKTLHFQVEVVDVSA